MKGTWWAGLILGAAMLLANNPSQRWPQVSRPSMYRRLVYPFLGAGALAFILGTVAWSGWLGDWPKAGDNERLRRIECVLYVDYGAYVGGFLAGIATVLLILHQRKKMTQETSQAAQK
jgi:membrane associated rhomboid family serine protease